MTRVGLVIEGVESSDGRWVAPGALVWDAEVPLFNPATQELVGLVRDIRREDDGSITGEVAIKIPDEYDPSVNLGDLELDESRPDQILAVLKGRIKGVALVEKGTAILLPPEAPNG